MSEHPHLKKQSGAAQHFGFVALIGAPNAGKSTLLNALARRRLAIVSPKARTTRFNLRAIVTEGRTQVAFVDTPGLRGALSDHRLDHTLTQAALEAQRDAYATLIVADASSRHVESTIAQTLEALTRTAHNDGKRSLHIPCLLALTKIDRRRRADLLPLVDRVQHMTVWQSIFLVSALKGDGVEDMRRAVCQAMPCGTWLFPPNMATDWPDHLIAAEVTREKLMRALHDEIPYGVAVVPEAWETRADHSILIRQTVYVARAAHRAIVLGKGGQNLRAIGESARYDLAQRFGKVVHLFLEVVHDKDWTTRESFWRMFGVDRTR